MLSDYELVIYLYWLLHSCNFSYTPTLGITTGGGCLHLTAPPKIIIKKTKPEKEGGGVGVVEERKEYNC